jgi:hypothetical protein
MADQYDVTGADISDDVPQDELDFVYGPGGGTTEVVPLVERRREFKPWHHPVKQIVRNRQWGALTQRLIGDIRPTITTLRYFTLPGPDLLDVRVLADVCAPQEIKVEFFGFDTAVVENGADGERTHADVSAAADAQAVLRQAGRITDESVVIRGRLEDIAITRTHEANQLRAQQPFHVINIDACNHLTFRQEGAKNLFDALQELLRHQTRAEDPWLLFLTTRCSPDRLCDAGDEFKNRIAANLELSPDEFKKALASVLNVDIADLEAALEAGWAARDANFLKLYVIGFGKYLLHLYNGQPASPADVELVSTYAYTIHPDDPPMLALAFRITPSGPQMYPPSTGGMVPLRDLEPTRAVRVAERAGRLWLLDEALNEFEIRREAVDGTVNLLRNANYDMAAWREWVTRHPTRPVDLVGTVAE